MKDYDKENMPESIVKNLEKYLNENEEMLSTVKNASGDVFSMLSWAKAMKNFYYVNKEVKPKKEKLAIAKEKVRVLQEKLAVKLAELKEAQDKVANLQANLDKTIADKEFQEQQYETNKIQLERAK